MLIKLRNAKKIIVAKALDARWSAVPVAPMCDGERGSSPEKVDDLCSAYFEALGLNLSINSGI